MANPWMKFYPRDWRGDQALRSVSIAARGLWMECLCIMHEATPYGHLVLNGSPVGDDTLARMAGVPVDEVRSLMGELRQAGVLSVTRKGVIFSRRMTKDHARAQKGKAAVTRRKDRQIGELGGTPQAPDTKQKSGAPNRYPTREPTTQKPEARIQNTDLVILFEDFWQAYPHRNGKKQKRKPSLQKFEAAVRRGVDPQQIIAGAKAFRQDRKALSNFAPDPSTWLNQEGWTDEIDTGPPDQPQTERQAKILRWKKMAQGGN